MYLSGFNPFSSLDFWPTLENGFLLALDGTSRPGFGGDLDARLRSAIFIVHT
jgi:hypothetical protein